MRMIGTRTGLLGAIGGALVLAAGTVPASAGDVAKARIELPAPALDRVTASGESFLANLRQAALRPAGIGSKAAREVFVAKGIVAEPKITVEAAQGPIERLRLPQDAD